MGGIEGCLFITFHGIKQARNYSSYCGGWGHGEGGFGIFPDFEGGFGQIFSSTEGGLEGYSG